MWTSRPPAVTAQFALLLMVALPPVSAIADSFRPPGDPVTLVLDDGSVEETSFNGAIIMVNRFSPEEFPLELTRVSVLWVPDPAISEGDPFWVFLYEDADGDIFTGTKHVATFPGTIQALDGFTFSNVDFDPVFFEGPGDVLLAVSMDSVPGSWAPRDTSDPIQLRSYVSAWGGEMPPPLPNGNTTGLLLFTNWPIRGEGTVLRVPVTLQSVSVD